ncbi:MAG: hypothetical protein IKI15_04420 [Lachnospiraceae bacterium]|nr:hypothetical protein [Lachnospiraceae bacterium]
MKHLESVKSTDNVKITGNIQTAKSKKTLKTLTILLLLAALTAAVVFVPQLISDRREAKRINKIIYRDYNASERAMLTDAEVAQLYFTRQIDINGNSRMVDSKGDDAALIRREVTEMTDRLFGKGNDLSDPFNERIEESTLSCFRSSCLILVDNQPTALNFVNCCVKDNDIVFEIVYEEKTKTLLRLAAEPITMLFRSRAEAEQYAAKVNAQIIEYLEGQLGLRVGEYRSYIDFSDVTEDTNGARTVNAVIRCEILQANEKGSDKN